MLMRFTIRRSEDKALGWNEFWEKLTPETREWYANVVRSLSPSWPILLYMQN